MHERLQYADIVAEERLRLLQEYNACHLPAGSSTGGQFCAKGAVGAVVQSGGALAGAVGQVAKAVGGRTAQGLKNLLVDQRGSWVVGGPRGKFKRRPVPNSQRGRTARSTRRVRRAVRDAVVAATGFTSSVQGLFGGEQFAENADRLLDLGEKAVDLLVTVWPLDLDTTLAGITQIASLMEAAGDHPALPLLRELETAYGTVALPSGDPRARRLHRFQRVVRALIDAYAQED